MKTIRKIPIFPSIAIIYLFVLIESAFGLLETPEHNHCQLQIKGPYPYSIKCGEFTCKEEGEGDEMHCILRNCEGDDGAIHQWCDCPSWNVYPSPDGGLCSNGLKYKSGKVEIECFDFGCIETKGSDYKCQELESGIPDNRFVYPCECRRKTQAPH